MGETTGRPPRGHGGEAEEATDGNAVPAWRAAASVAAAAIVVAAGAGAAVAWSRIAHGGARELEGEARARWYAADRDAGEVVALDDDFLVVRRFAVELPLELEARRDGGLWVASATAAGPLGAHRLRRLEAGGDVAAEVAIGPVLDLDTLQGGPALVVALASGSREALLVHSAGASLGVAVGRDLACIAGAEARIAVGTEGGVLRLHDAAGGALVGEAHLGGRLADVAAGPEPGTWWALDAHGGPNARRLLLVEPDLSVRWERPIGLLAQHLAPVAGEERVWLADATAPLARRFGPRGTVEVPFAQLAQAGCERGAARTSAGAVFAAPGALLVLDPAGQPLPGQGGFSFLVDVARARGP